MATLTVDRFSGHEETPLISRERGLQRANQSSSFCRSLERETVSTEIFFLLSANRVLVVNESKSQNVVKQNKSSIVPMFIIVPVCEGVEWRLLLVMPPI